MKRPEQIYKNEFGAYMLRITEAQIERVKDFNSRAKEPWLAGGTYCDGVEIVSNDDFNADMITGHWFGMVIGILPNGEAHS